MSKLKYFDFMKLYFSKTQANVLTKVYKGRERNKLFHSKTSHLYEAKDISNRNRKKRIIITYILLFLYILSIVLFSFINIMSLFGILLIPIFLYILCDTLNFSFLKVLLYQKLYNDNSNSNKELLNELFLSNDFKKILNIDNHIICIEKSRLSLYLRKYTLYHKKSLNINIHRNKIVINSGKYTESISNDEINLIDLKIMLNEKINDFFQSKHAKYSWVYKTSITKNKSFSVYGFNLKLKKLQCENKIIQINDPLIPNVKTAVRYRFFDKDFNEYFLLLSKIDNRTYALFEKKEII